MKHGFTLIELAVVLIVVSLMVGFGLQAFQTTTSFGCYQKTENQLKTIDRALQAYIGANNRLPKPASLSMGSNNAQFGYEQTGGIVTSVVGYATTVPAGMTNQGGVLIGALPHATLGLAGEMAADCWGSKFTYAVSNALTSSNAINGYPTGADGVAVVNNAAGNEISMKVAYVVVSHGQDKMGATPLSAADITARNCNSATTKIDRENCNTGNAVFIHAARNTGDNAANYFDDVVIFSNRLSSTATASCAAGTLVTWNTNCASVTGSTLSHGSSAALTNTAPSYMGGVTVTCNNGVLDQSGATCASSVDCAPGTLTWGPGNICNASFGWIVNGGSQAVTNDTAGYSGAATIICASAVASVAPGATCNELGACTSQAVNWSTNCSGLVGNLSNGGSATISNTNSGYVGTVMVSCNSGVLSQASQVCNPAPSNDCGSQMVSWGGNCSATAGALTNGSSASVGNAASGYTGTATATCNNGTTMATGTCNANCGAQTVTWGSGNCSASVGALTSGASSSATNTAAGYTGSATVSCSNGTVNTSGATCTASCPVGGYRYEEGRCVTTTGASCQGALTKIAVSEFQSIGGPSTCGGALCGVADIPAYCFSRGGIALEYHNNTYGDGAVTGNYFIFNTVTCWGGASGSAVALPGVSSIDDGSGNLNTYEMVFPCS